MSRIDKLYDRAERVGLVLETWSADGRRRHYRYQRTNGIVLTKVSPILTGIGAAEDWLQGYTSGLWAAKHADD